MFASKRLLGLDVGSSALKVVECARRGSDLVLKGYRIVARTGADEPVAAAIARLLGAYAPKTRRVASSVSGRSVIVRYLSMPPLDDGALAEAIRVEADKYIPFDLDEVLLDCQALDRGAGGETMRVVLVAVKRAVVDELAVALTAGGLAPRVIDVDAFALGNAYELVERTHGTTDGALALIDLGAGKTHVNIRLAGLTQFTREIYLGGEAFDDALARALGIPESEAERLKQAPFDELPKVMEALAPVIADLANEIQLSLQFFESQFARPVEKVALSGGMSRLEGLDQALADALARPVERWDPVAALRVAGGVDKEALARDGSQLACAVGLATRLLDPAARR